MKQSTYFYLLRRGVIGGGGAAASLLLDTYSGAAAAYSLRLLRTEYTGNAIRVRRESDNEEQDIPFRAGAGGKILDTTTLESFCDSSDGFVTTWYDQSGNANNATQTTAASQPKIVSNGTTITDNGKPVLQDGIGMTINASITTSGFAQFAVAKNLSTGGKNIMNYYVEGTTNRYVLLAENGSTSPAFGFTGANFPDTQRLNGSSFSYSSRDVVWDNTLNQSLLTLNWETLSSVNELDSFGWTSTSFGMYDMQEFIIYPTNQSSNISGIETNINDFYSIY